MFPNTGSSSRNPFYKTYVNIFIVRTELNIVNKNSEKIENRVSEGADILEPTLFYFCELVVSAGWEPKQLPRSHHFKGPALAATTCKQIEIKHESAVAYLLHRVMWQTEEVVSYPWYFQIV